jgi:hypothetical protein
VRSGFPSGRARKKSPRRPGKVRSGFPSGRARKKSSRRPGKVRSGFPSGRARTRRFGSAWRSLRAAGRGLRRLLASRDRLRGGLAPHCCARAPCRALRVRIAPARTARRERRLRVAARFQERAFSLRALFANRRRCEGAFWMGSVGMGYVGRYHYCEEAQQSARRLPHRRGKHPPSAAATDAQALWPWRPSNRIRPRRRQG